MRSCWRRPTRGGASLAAEPTCADPAANSSHNPTPATAHLEGVGEHPVGAARVQRPVRGVVQHVAGNAAAQQRRGQALRESEHHAGIQAFRRSGVFVMRLFVALLFDETRLGVQQPRAACRVRCTAGAGPVLHALLPTPHAPRPPLTMGSRACGSSEIIDPAAIQFVFSFLGAGDNPG